MLDGNVKLEPIKTFHFDLLKIVTSQGMNGFICRGELDDISEKAQKARNTDLPSTHFRQLKISGGEYRGLHLPEGMPAPSSGLPGFNRGEPRRGGTYQNIDPPPVIDG